MSGKGEKSITEEKIVTSLQFGSYRRLAEKLPDFTAMVIGRIQALISSRINCIDKLRNHFRLCPYRLKPSCRIKTGKRLADYPRFCDTFTIIRLELLVDKASNMFCYTIVDNFFVLTNRIFLALKLLLT